MRPKLDPASADHLSSDPHRPAVQRHCKIARLPADLREQLNLMLHDGASYSAIIKHFRQPGHPLNQASLSRWNAHGFQEWLRHQAWLDEMRARLDFASSIVNPQCRDPRSCRSLRG